MHDKYLLYSKQILDKITNNAIAIPEAGVLH